MSLDGPLLPSGKDDRLLPFYKQGDDDRFEQICVEIAETEPEIRAADKKNKQFRVQYGVDVEAFDEDHSPVLVISCKNYGTIRPNNITKWGDDFLNHWDSYWKNKGVRRFALAITVELNRDAVQDNIRTEKARFKAIGIEYECWGLQQLTSKLKNRPQLIARFFHTAWVEVICGTHVLSQISGTVAPIAGVGAVTYGDATQAILRELADATEQRFEYAQELAQKGNSNQVIALRREVREKSVVWEGLSGKMKGRILRSQALAEIDKGNIEDAQKLLDDAEIFHPAADQTIRALLVLRRDGAERALNVLSSPATGREMHLRAALMLELGRPEKALMELSLPLSDVPVSERLRLQAITYALQGDFEEALAKLEEMAQLPDLDFACINAAVALRFHISLAPKTHLQLGIFPNPIPPTLTRQDDRSAALRADAVAIIDGRLDSCDEQHRSNLEVWKAACLLVDDVRRREGLEFVSGLLKRNNPSPGAIAWALAYGADMDRRRLCQTLEGILDRGGTAAQAAALALLTRVKRGAKQALKVIERYGPQFTRADDAALMNLWRRQLANGDDRVGEDGELQRLAKAVRRTKDPASLINYLASETTTVEALTAGVEFLAQAGYNSELNVLRKRLLALKTSRAVEIAAHAAFASGDYTAVPALLDSYRQVSAAGALPYQLRILGSEAGRRQGDVRLAIQMLGVDAFDREKFDASMRHARLIADIGNIEGAAALLRTHSSTDSADPRKTLDLAYKVRHVDPQLSRAIVEKASEYKLEGIALTSALHLAFELGLGDLQNKLLPTFHEQATRGALPGVTALNADEAMALIRRQAKMHQHARELWLQGEVPAHVAFEADMQAVLGIYFDAWVSSEAKLPMLIHSAATDRAASIENLSKIKIRCDVTALLVAARFKLFDLLDVAAEVTVASGAGAAILELEECAACDAATQPLVPMLAELRRNIANRLETGRWRGLPERPSLGRIDEEMSTQFSLAALIQPPSRGVVAGMAQGVELA